MRQRAKHGAVGAIARHGRHHHHARFPQYDSGETGYQNITIATGSDAISTSSILRRPESGSANPLLTITLGQGLPANGGLGLTTIFSGATLQTDPALNFPNGTYNATITLVVLGA